MFQICCGQAPQELGATSSVHRSCGILPPACGIESAVHHLGVTFTPGVCVGGVYREIEVYIRSSITSSSGDLGKQIDLYVQKEIKVCNAI